MELSLTKEQLLERLLTPERTTLLALAIKEDADKVFPLHFQARNQTEINIDITEAIGTLCSKWLWRAIDLAYNEALD